MKLNGIWSAFLLLSIVCTITQTPTIGTTKEIDLEQACPFLLKDTEGMTYEVILNCTDTLTYVNEKGILINIEFSKISTGTVEENGIDDWVMELNPLEGKTITGRVPYPGKTKFRKDGHVILGGRFFTAEIHHPWQELHSFQKSFIDLPQRSDFPENSDLLSTAELTFIGDHSSLVAEEIRSFKRIPRGTGLGYKYNFSSFVGPEIKVDAYQPVTLNDDRISIKQGKLKIHIPMVTLAEIDLKEHSLKLRNSKSIQFDSLKFGFRNFFTAHTPLGKVVFEEGDLSTVKFGANFPFKKTLTQAMTNTFEIATTQQGLFHTKNLQVALEVSHEAIKSRLLFDLLNDAYQNKKTHLEMLPQRAIIQNSIPIQFQEAFLLLDIEQAQKIEIDKGRFTIELASQGTMEGILHSDWANLKITFVDMKNQQPMTVEIHDLISIIRHVQIEKSSNGQLGLEDSN
ncbi:MAG: hypothetical protein R3B74_10800 [Nitrospirales bacterium]|nr:hypothetical protein [Nitrospirales bacterium]